MHTDTICKFVDPVLYISTCSSVTSANSCSLLLLFVFLPLNCLANIDLSHAKYISLCVYTEAITTIYIALILNNGHSQLCVVLTLENDMLSLSKAASTSLFFFLPFNCLANIDLSHTKYISLCVYTEAITTI